MSAPARFKFAPGPFCHQDKLDMRSLKQLEKRFGTMFYVADALFYQRRVLATHLRETLREGRERLALIKELTAQLEKLSTAYDQRVAERDALRAQLAKRTARAPRRSVRVRA